MSPATTLQESPSRMSPTALTAAPVVGNSVANASAPVRLACRNLNFFYGDAQALKNINLDFHDRQVTALIGPSGCGKSTLLRTFTRIYSLYPEQRADGEIILDGRNILAPSTDLNELRARVGMVFQKPTPFPMSIYDNIAFGVRLYEKHGRGRVGDAGADGGRGGQGGGAHGTGSFLKAGCSLRGGRAHREASLRRRSRARIERPRIESVMRSAPAQASCCQFG